MGFKNHISVPVAPNYLLLQRICTKYMNTKYYCQCIPNISAIFKNTGTNNKNKLLALFISYIKLVFQNVLLLLLLKRLIQVRFSLHRIFTNCIIIAPSPLFLMKAYMQEKISKQTKNSQNFDHKYLAILLWYQTSTLMKST